MKKKRSHNPNRIAKLWPMLGVAILFSGCKKEDPVTCGWPAEKHFYSQWDEPLEDWTPYVPLALEDKIVFSDGNSDIELSVEYNATTTEIRSSAQLTPNPECPHVFKFHQSHHLTRLRHTAANSYELQVFDSDPLSEDQGQDFLKITKWNNGNTVNNYMLTIRYPHPPIDASNRHLYLSANTHFCSTLEIAGVSYQDVYIALHPQTGDTLIAYQKSVGILAIKENGSWFVKQ